MVLKIADVFAMEEFSAVFVLSSLAKIALLFFLRNLQASVRTRRILLLNTKTVQESPLNCFF